MAGSNYYSQLYEEEDICPISCNVNAIKCYGVIYTYRKSWIRRKLKQKIIFQTSESCRNFLDEDSLRQVRTKVKLRVENALKFLNESKHIK